jgi:hypothetical protein
LQNGVVRHATTTFIGSVAAALNTRL